MRAREPGRRALVAALAALPLLAGAARAAEIGFQQISEVLGVPGADLVGPLPEALQRVIPTREKVDPLQRGTSGLGPVRSGSVNVFPSWYHCLLGGIADAVGAS